MKTNYVLTLKAEDRPGLLHLVSGIINRKQVPIESLTAAKTDVHSIVLITIELYTSERVLTPLVLKLKNIIEVHAIQAIKLSETICQRAVFFKMAKPFMETRQLMILQKYSASVINVYPDSVLISKSGYETEIRNLYNELEGPYLLGFSQTGLITDDFLKIDEDQSLVLSRLAA